MPQLNKKEKAFCRKYLETGDVKKSAEFSGIKKDPYDLLEKDDVQNEIKRIGGALKRGSESVIKSALIRLAVGDVSDAVSLLFSDKPCDLKNLDLFMVSEIKRKGDTTEIKFFDRFKALKSLIEGFSNDEDAVPFYDALLSGAEKLEQSDYED
jgi:hypothetical protein